MNNEHILLCVMGKTATGKDSLVDALCQHNNIQKVISYTTRPRRENEGDTHYFVTEDVYHQMKTEEQIAAETQIGQYYYWATIEQLYKCNVYIIDYLGLKKLRELNLPGLKFVTVYIHAPDDIREYRALSQRGDEKKKWRVRNYSEKEQFRQLEKAVDYNYSIQNLSFPKAYSVFKWISTVEQVIPIKPREV